MKICDAILAESSDLPAFDGMFQYVVARNGLFIRGEDSRMRAVVQVAACTLFGPAEIEPMAELKVDRVPGVWLRSVLASARQRLPNEAMYEFIWDGTEHHAVTHTWRCLMPRQRATPTAVDVLDIHPDTVVDLHSHNSMAAFFSETDDADEQGLRFYAVIGRIDTDAPEIRVRVGVYGHFMDVPAEMIFDDLGPFEDQYSVISSQSSEEEEPARACRVCGCTDEHGCENGCFWVEDDLCSNCVVSVYDRIPR